ncbi:MAG: nuclear transport factor 2 family protein [Chloroflexi bacterium]|nr:nuclear transport factor 2 family protein [Chloroflexota bacterium]
MFSKSPCPVAAVTRLQQAWNMHDPDGLEACLHPCYQSLHPNHPERNFSGRLAARLSWAAVFEAVPDLRAELLHYAVINDTVWTEWRWHGEEHVSGVPFEAQGVMIFTIADDLITQAQVYTEILETTGPDWDQVLDNLLQNDSEQSF